MDRGLPRGFGLRGVGTTVRPLGTAHGASGSVLRLARFHSRTLPALPTTQFQATVAGLVSEYLDVGLDGAVRLRLHLLVDFLCGGGRGKEARR